MSPAAIFAMFGPPIQQIFSTENFNERNKITNTDKRYLKKKTQKRIEKAFKRKEWGIKKKVKKKRKKISSKSRDMQAFFRTFARYLLPILFPLYLAFVKETTAVGNNDGDGTSYLINLSATVETIF